MILKLFKKQKKYIGPIELSPRASGIANPDYTIESLVIQQITFSKIITLCRSWYAASSVAAWGSGWLGFHEGVGHTIAHHVGKTDAQLIARLNSSSRITGASTFANQTTAEPVISATIGANRATLNAWLRSGSTRNLVLPYTGNSVIGRGIMRGQSAVSNLSNASVVLKPNGSGGYNILTAFPR